MFRGSSLLILSISFDAFCSRDHAARLQVVRATSGAPTDITLITKQNRRQKMKERLGLGVIPGTGWSADEIQAVAREAEDAGFDAIFSAEVNNDAMATAQLMGSATSRILVGTWVANIYL